MRGRSLRPGALILGAVVLTAGLLPSCPASEGRQALPDVPLAERVSWTTYGFDSSRSGFNPSEHRLGPSNAGHLQLAWRVPLGGATITSPVVAADVGEDHLEIVYVATESGEVDAVDSSTGHVLWRREFGSVRTACPDVPNGRFGVSSTPVIDTASDRLYVAASATGGVSIHALDLATGDEASGWPVSISANPTHMHVWGALTLSRGLVYAGFAGMCDIPLYYGQVVAVDTAEARVTAQWFAVRDRGYPVGGGGVWGYGGVSVDSTNGAVYLATGNALPPVPEDHPDGESVVRLTPALTKVAAHRPHLSGIDVDFGATPLLFRVPGCPPQLAVVNKAGALFLYDRDRIDEGPVQRLVVAGLPPKATGLLIGVPAYSPETRMLYVVDPGPERAPFRHGLLAFREGPGCRLALAWQQIVGPEAKTSFASPTVANGVVYFANGEGRRVLAFDARTGRRLWESSLGGAGFAATVVVNGRFYVASWDGARGALSAFTP